MTPADERETIDADRMRKVLHFVAELGEVVASSTEMKPILDWFVQNVTPLLEADEGRLSLLTEDDTSSTHTVVRVRPGSQNASGSWPHLLDTIVTGHLMAQGGHLATPDITADERLPFLKGLDTRVRSVLAVPLKVHDRMSGVLAVTQSGPGRHWSQDEVELLTIVARNSAEVIERARLRLEAEAKKRLEEEARRVAQELKAAADTQMFLVPSQPLRLERWQVTGSVTPARQVGGDSFDYFLVGGRRLALAIGDVSGKGMPAALLMGAAQGALRSICNTDRPLPVKIRLLNREVTQKREPGKFITLFYGELDPDGGALRYVNAGHNYPLLRHADGHIETLVDGGLMLGFAEDTDYVEGEAAMGPGDSLLLYSDGVTEAMDLRRRDYGDERLQQVWGRCGALGPEAAIREIMRDVESFRGGAPQSDDITLVVLGAAPA